MLLRKAIIYAKPYSIKIIFVIFFIIVGTVLALIRPILWAKLLTQLYAQEYKYFLYTIMQMSLLYVSLTFTNYIQSNMVIKINTGMIYDLKKDVYAKILNMRITMFDKMTSGQITSRLYNDVNEIVGLITSQLLSTIVDLMKVFIIGIAIIKINVYLSIIVLLTFPITWIISIKSANVFRKHNNIIKSVQDKYYSSTQESINKIREIKSLNLTDKFFEEYKNIALDLKNKSVKVSKLSIFFSILNGMVSFISEAIIFILGGFFIYIKIMNVEKFITFNSYFRQFSQALMNLININPRIQSVMISLERIFKLLDNFEESHEAFGDEVIENVEGNIEFKDINFAYNDNKNVLNNINIRINKNSKVAFVGKSGSGKTTVFNLLLRFYDYDSGKVLLDGTDIKKLNMKFLRDNISIIMQIPELFSMSILDNIKIANEKASFDEVIKSCKKAGIHEFIESLPLKYDTIIGTEGVNLSVGQKQRIAIASFSKEFKNNIA